MEKIELKLFICITIIISTLLSCSYLLEDDDDCDLGYKPDNCIEFKPSEGEIRLQVTINELNPLVPIEIFLGDFEDNQLVLRDSISNYKSYELLNGRYSVKATYKAIFDSVEVNIYSINGFTIEPNEKEYCDGTCYTIKILDVDAKLEY